MNDPTPDKCCFCGEEIDPADGDVVSDDEGHYRAHGACQDEYDELVQNELDHDPIGYDFLD